MLRTSLCLLLTAMFASAVFAQGRVDIQSLEYEFGRDVGVNIQPTPTPHTPITRPVPVRSECPCVPAIHAPVERRLCCLPVHPVYRPVSPCYVPVQPCYVPCRPPVLHRRVLLHRRAFVPPVPFSPYPSWCR